MKQPTRARNTETTQDQGTVFGQGRRSRQVDALMDDYITWREACGSVATAYESWKGAARGDREIAFSVYEEALDREEQAASTYRRSVVQIAGAQEFR
jgi:hypothetical protein